jgi:hypothetical protein
MALESSRLVAEGGSGFPLLVPDHDTHTLSRVVLAKTQIVHHLSHDGESKTTLLALGNELAQIELGKGHILQSLTIM